MKPTIHRKRIQENLECAICLEEFKDPRYLECGHSFCLGCIKMLDDRKHQKITCPECRQKTTIGDNGGKMKKLPQASNLSRIQRSLHEQSMEKPFCTACYDEELKNFIYCDTCKILCTKCADVHQSHPIYSGHEIRPLNEQDICPDHSDNILGWVCVPCKEAVCGSCVMKSHNTHDWRELGEYMEEIHSKVASFTSKKSILTEEVTLLKDHQKQLEKDFNHWKENADKFTGHLDEFLVCFKKLKEKKAKDFKKRVSKLTDRTNILDQHLTEEMKLHDKGAELFSENSTSKPHLQQMINEACILLGDMEKHSTKMGKDPSSFDFPVNDYASNFKENVKQLVNLLSVEFLDAKITAPKPQASAQKEEACATTTSQSGTANDAPDTTLPDTIQAGGDGAIGSCVLPQLGIRLQQVALFPLRISSPVFDFILNPKNKTLAVYAICPTEDGFQDPISTFSYSGDLIDSFGRNDFSKAGSLFELLQDCTELSICYDVRRGVYVINRASKELSSSALLKVNQEGGRILRLKKRPDFQVRINAICYLADVDRYVCLDDTGQHIAFVHPKKGKILNAFPTKISHCSSISVGRLDRKEILVYLETGDHPEQVVLVDNKGKELKRLLLPFSETVVGAELGPNGIFLRHLNALHISYITTSAGNNSTGCKDPEAPNIGRITLPGFDVYHEDIIKISHLRYDNKNKILAVAITERCSGTEITSTDIPTGMYTFQVNSLDDQ